MTDFNKLTVNLPIEFGQLSDTLANCDLRKIRVVAYCHVSFWKSSTYTITVSLNVCVFHRGQGNGLMTDPYKVKGICYFGQ
jgi:hypothetical protein